MSKSATSRKSNGTALLDAPSPSRKPVRNGNGSGGGSNRPGKMVYYFGKTKTEGDPSLKPLLGGKGANLADMTSIGLPVPPGFTITTETCAAYYKAGQQIPYGLMNEVNKNIAFLEAETQKKF